MRSTLLRAWLGGALLSGVPSTAVALLRRDSLTNSTRAAGTMLGRSSLGRGALVHAGVSAWWTWVLWRAGIRDPWRGAAAGAAIAAIDLGVVARRGRLPALAALPIGPQVMDHIAFGAIVGALLGAGVSGRGSRARPGAPRR
jgi:hypothetical protein